MWRPVFLSVVLACALGSSGLGGSGSPQSLGELARKERERKQAQAASRTQTVESPGVGIRLVIPMEWKAQDNPNPLQNQFILDCAPEHFVGCRVMVESLVLPRNKAAISDTDRREWESLEHFPAGSRRVSSREFQLAGRPAHEAIFQSAEGIERRYVRVFARDGGRLYTFESTAFWDSKDHLEEYSPLADRVIESLSPVGQPSPEEVETATVIAGFSPEERAASENVSSLMLMELMCKGMVGKYVSLDQVLKGCQSRKESEGAAITFTLTPQKDPRHDPNYEYRAKASADTLELLAAPRRAGLGGFLSDGMKIYFNPQGVASARDKKIYELNLSAASAAAAPSAPGAPATPAAPRPGSAGKKVWTEEELHGLRGNINVGGGAGARTSEEAPAEAPRAESSRGATLRSRGYVERKELRPEEQTAHQYLVAISSLENDECKRHLNRYCSLEELMGGVEVEPGRIAGFRPGREPTTDRNYEYRLDLRSDGYSVSAEPRRAGLGGLFHDGFVGHYNPDGTATKGDPGVMGPVSWGSLIRH